LGRLHHRNQMLTGAPFTAAGQAHAVAHFEEAGHVLGPLDIAAEPEQVLCGASEHSHAEPRLGQRLLPTLPLEGRVVELGRRPSGTRVGVSPSPMKAGFAETTTPP